MITLHPVLNRRMLGVALLAQFGIASIVVGQSPRVPSASRDPHDRGGMGASIFVLDSAALAELHARTLTEALTATLPGVSVMQSSGRVGDGPRVRIRGESGFLSVLQPILYVDGVRVNAEQVSSRLDDIDLNDVERLEVLPRIRPLA
jgi:outer membrane receptor protein involved in Fe transport